MAARIGGRFVGAAWTALATLKILRRDKNSSLSFPQKSEEKSGVLNAFEKATLSGAVVSEMAARIGGRFVGVAWISPATPKILRQNKNPSLSFPRKFEEKAGLFIGEILTLFPMKKKL
jgi:hypothetical protein